MEDGLEVALHWLTSEFDGLQQKAQADRQAAEDNDRRLDTLEDRVARLAARVGVPFENAAAPGTLRVVDEPSEPPDWDELVASARSQLLGRGVDVGSLDLDSLLDPEVVKRIERRFSGSFRVESRLDRYDVLATVAAGLVAALVDVLLVRIPTDVLYLGEHHQSGSPLRSQPIII